MSIYLICQDDTDSDDVIEDSSYDVKLDENGVYISNYTITLEPQQYSWNQYKYYIEYDDYLFIKLKNSGSSCLPKCKELSEVIEYAKTKIPNKTDVPDRKNLRGIS